MKGYIQRQIGSSQDGYKYIAENGIKKEKKKRVI